MRPPDAILLDLSATVDGETDPDVHSLLWEVLNDVIDTLNGAGRANAGGVVTDYVANHYGVDEWGVAVARTTGAGTEQ